jgi:dTDP-4-dehydrorhamnose 3,5-epimerase
MGAFAFEPCPIAGMYQVRSIVSADERGRFRKLFDADAFAAVAPAFRVVQTNLSMTKGAGTVRGMHFQHAPSAEYKLVGCLRGRVQDVVVDLRKSSATWLRWHAAELREDDDVQLLIPPGCAHGFQTLTACSELLYQHSAVWNPAAEGGVRHDDPALAIAWQLRVTQISERDRSFPLIDAAFQGART